MADSHSKGCLYVFILAGAALLFLIFYNPNAVDGETVTLAPESSWSLNLETNVESPNGVYRMKNMSAFLIHDDDSIPIAVIDRDSASKSFNDLEIAVVTLKGVPVVSGKEDIDIKLKFDLPKGELWNEREAIIRMRGDLEYPFYDFVDLTLGTLGANVKMEVKSIPIATEQKIKISTVTKSSYSLYIRRTVVVILGVLLLIGIYLFFKPKSD